jgi:hypothetical protein
MANRVRTHTRKTPGGGTARVRQHTRAGRPRQGLVSPEHSLKLLKKAIAHGRKKRRVLAMVFGGLAAAELGGWLAFEGIGFGLVTIGVLAVGTGTLVAALGGGRP